MCICSVSSADHATLSHGDLSSCRYSFFSQARACPTFPVQHSTVLKRRCSDASVIFGQPRASLAFKNATTSVRGWLRSDWRGSLPQWPAAKECPPYPRNVAVAVLRLPTRKNATSAVGTRTQCLVIGAHWCTCGRCTLRIHITDMHRTAANQIHRVLQRLPHRCKHLLMPSAMLSAVGMRLRVHAHPRLTCHRRHRHRSRRYRRERS